MAEPAEKSLDDFFAKRDKKKRKDKGGAGSAGASGGRSGNMGSGRPQPEGGQSGGRPAGKPEDEWKEFEQKEVDYSGLRIQSLQISNEREDDENDRREDQGGDGEEQGSGVEKVTGPWNKTAPAQAPAPVVEAAPEPVQSGVYRPPGARSGAVTRKPQGPPEIYNDSQFPSLQSTAKHIESRSLP
ncbi:protein CDV3 homolog isoform X2 [Ambystoma mexicanum]|uniref:protein CDV3 homolog isoform X2 n=1 Tax=Ambystoma mexicanum TaxID=8296 RepID=UPI0037E776AE